jgi:hypothetical protein
MFRTKEYKTEKKKTTKTRYGCYGKTEKLKNTAKIYIDVFGTYKI